MKGPILVVLAAGMGNRYGGLKQMEKIGKNGEVLLDYSVYDAVQSGFEKIVFIIRQEIEKDFRELVLARMESKVKCELAFQEKNSLIPDDVFKAAQEAGRTKPWGTAHALLCAKDNIDAPFSVINADDFYGREAFAVMGKHLLSSDASPCIVPYLLEKTLSPQGTVTRGVCEVEGGYLVSVDELLSIEKKDGMIFNTGTDGSIRELSPKTYVSMNFWGFLPNILPELKNYFDDFLETFYYDVERKKKSECFLPKAVDYFLKNNICKVKVLDTNSDWFGVTYKDDREEAIKKIEGLTSAGVYPASLWN
jgi:NDP-sugar pyrophosphorylase family protein